MILNDLINEVHRIDPEIKYWLVRTSGGRYYDDFAINKKIGFGENYISPEEVLKFPKTRDEFSKELAPIVAEHTESMRPGSTAGQFYRFYYEMKKGDLVIIPSESSDRLWVGRITDDQPIYFQFKDENGDVTCPHIHTRSVEWIAEKFRSDFNPKIISLFFSHHAIVDANEYAQFINGGIYDFFIHDNKAHLILRVETRQHIRARTLMSLFSNIFDIAQDYSEVTSQDLSVDNIDIRLNLNSPGAVELISSHTPTILAIGLLIVAIVGGKFKTKGMELGSDGLVKQIADFLYSRDKSRLQSEFIRQATRDLEIRDPKEISKLLDKLWK